MTRNQWKSYVFGGATLIAIALLAFVYCTYCESQGHMRGPRLLIALYVVIGKWGIAAIGIAAGLLSIAMGVSDRKRERKYLKS